MGLVPSFLFPGRKTVYDPEWPIHVLHSDTMNKTSSISTSRTSTMLLMPPRETPCTGIVLMFHGNGETLCDMFETGRYIQQHFPQLAFAAAEYDGYGEQKGTMTWSRTRSYEIAHDAIEHTVRWAKQFQPILQNNSDEKQRPARAALPLCIIGRSIGTGFAGHICGQPNLAKYVSAVILISPFSSIKECVRERGAPTFLMGEWFPTQTSLQRFKGHVLIVHGTADDIIPYAHGDRLWKDACTTAASKHLLALADVGHIFDVDQFAIQPALSKWLQLEYPPRR